MHREKNKTTILDLQEGNEIPVYGSNGASLLLKSCINTDMALCANHSHLFFFCLVLEV